MTYESRRSRPWAARLVGGGVAILLVGVYLSYRFDGSVRSYVDGKVAARHPAAAAPPAEQAKAQPPAVPVTAAAAEVGDFPIVLVGLGTVEANNTVLIRSRVDGQITKINFSEGQIVQKGDLLVEIDPRPYRAALEQAPAKNEQAAIDNAQTQLDYATIRAPLTGRVGFRLTDQGNIVNASSTTGIVEIAQLQPISVIFTEPENSLPQLQKGVSEGKVPVMAFSSDGRTKLEEGALDTVNNTVDASSGTIRIKALFDNEDNKLWPGLSVTTRTTVAIRRNVVIVPDTAVQRSQDGFYAYVVGPDSKVQVRKLKIGTVSDSKALIEDGIKAGDQVVIAGQYRLQPGTLVKVGQQATASAGP